MADVDYIYSMIDESELIDFSANFSIARPDYLGDSLFPDSKVENIVAEAKRISRYGELPRIAPVHALDTEAVIGERPTWEKFDITKSLIKEKIDLGEQLSEVLTYGMRSSQVLDWVYDDLAREGDKVKARTELMKMQAITTGTYDVVENRLDFSVDLGVPAENFVTADWSDPDADILSDIYGWVQQQRTVGKRPVRAITSPEIMALIVRNTGIQQAIFGVNSSGVMPSETQINTFFVSQFNGLTITTYEQQYANDVVDPVAGTRTVEIERFFPEDRFVMLSEQTAGRGIWGVTPEERAAFSNTWDVAQQGQLYVMYTQWKEKDPVVTWSKASGMFVPLITDPYGIFSAEITIEAATDPGTGGGGAGGASAVIPQSAPVSDEDNSVTYGGIE